MTDAMEFSKTTTYTDEHGNTLKVKENVGGMVVLEDTHTGAILKIPLTEAQQKIQQKLWEYRGGPNAPTVYY